MPFDQFGKDFSCIVLSVEGSLRGMGMSLSRILHQPRFGIGIGHWRFRRGSVRVSDFFRFFVAECFNNEEFVF